MSNSRAGQLLSTFESSKPMTIKPGEEEAWFNAFLPELNKVTGQTFTGKPPVSARGYVTTFFKSDKNMIQVVFDTDRVYNFVKAVTYKGEGPQSIITDHVKTQSEVIASIQTNIKHMSK